MNRCSTYRITNDKFKYLTMIKHFFIYNSIIINNHYFFAITIFKIIILILKCIDRT